MPTIQNKRGTEYNKVTTAALKAGEIAFYLGNDAEAGLGMVGVDGQVNTAIPFRAGSSQAADRLATARNITLAGDVETTAAVSFNGSADITINTKIGNGKITKDMLDTAVTASIDKANDSVQAVTAATGNSGVTIGGTATAPTISIKIDPAADNALKVTADGLKVEAGAAPEYTVVKKAQPSTGMSATYQLQKDGADVTGSVIDIPAGGATITSGSSATDPVVLTIGADNKITASLTDGKITLAKLDTGVQTSLGKADSAVQPADITTGGTDGTIKIGNTEVKVKGLGDAAYKTVGGANGVAGLDANGKLADTLIPDISADYVSVDKLTETVATLDGDKKVPTNQLPIATKTKIGVVMATDEIEVAADGKATVGSFDCGTI